MRTKRFYMYWLIYSFALNSNHCIMICTAYKAEIISYSIALVLLISASIFACTFCTCKQFMKGVMKNQHRFSNNSLDPKECYCSYIIINYKINNKAKHLNAESCMSSSAYYDRPDHNILSD